jgi:hypothetical protein
MRTAARTDPSIPRPAPLAGLCASHNPLYLYFVAAEVDSFLVVF